MSHLDDYAFAVEKLSATFPEIKSIYAAHHKEMNERLERDGFLTAPFNLNERMFFGYNDAGSLLHCTARHKGKAVGYANFYIVKTIHEQELISKDDAIYVVPAHRNGVGKKLVEFAVRELKARGAKKIFISSTTDKRASKLWERMGFRELNTIMVLE